MSASHSDSVPHLFFLCASALSVRQECETKSGVLSGWVGGGHSGILSENYPRVSPPLTKFTTPFFGE